MKKNKNTTLRSLELLLIYIAVPLFTAYQLQGIYNLVPLLGMGILLLVLLLRNRGFHNKRFLRLVPVNWAFLIGRFVLVSALVYGFIRFFHRDLLYYLPQENFDRYLLAVALYPFWSVIPQEIVYRAWYYHRYSDLFPNAKVSVLLNSAFFGFSHIVFGNWVAITGAFLVSFVFSHTYRRYNSLLIVVIEHFLYGVMIFSLGMGRFFK
ncbi:CPBP family intramembrane glutamic endopeptidase [Pontibacter pamirensis]|uniref:CPBP family intramembrane glutamic endopeptidase n=1 Tax=Pontibacter pamirensis TaxID=2562824 RepID=UPI00138956DF|nr:CPBP family intramembrane glutamic endopeptidase [Pontibacter pamirensis]